MKLKNQYYILRHGQTIYQVERKKWTYPRVDSHKVRLTKKGEKQIKAAARKLKRKKIDLIFASDFFRTRQTARIVAKELGVKKMIFDKRLRDINLGVYRGKLKDEFYPKFPKYSKTRFKKTPPQGENWLDVKKRMVAALKSIDKKSKGKIILVVSHAESLWLLEGAVKNWHYTKFLRERKNNYIDIAELRKLYGN